MTRLKAPYEVVDVPPNTSPGEKEKTETWEPSVVVHQIE
jgi:hypothetical protein